MPFDWLAIPRSTTKKQHYFRVDENVHTLSISAQPSLLGWNEEKKMKKKQCQSVPIRSIEADPSGFPYFSQKSAPCQRPASTSLATSQSQIALHPWLETPNIPAKLEN